MVLMALGVEVSPSELLKAYLDLVVDREAISAIVVGPLTHQQQQAGSISLTDAGQPQETTAGVESHRCNVRCVGPSTTVALRMGRYIRPLLHEKYRLRITQPSNGLNYLVHSMHVVGGPSLHYDSPKTWETLLFAESLISRNPVP